MVGAAGQQRVVRVRDLVVADDVLPVDRNPVRARDPRDEARRGRVLGPREARRVERHPLVLDPDRLRVDPPVAGVPGDVRVTDDLDDPARAGDDVVGGRMRLLVPQPRERSPERPLGDVDDDQADVHRLPCGVRVALAPRQPRRRGAAGEGAARGGHDQRGERAREEKVANCRPHERVRRPRSRDSCTRSPILAPCPTTPSRTSSARSGSWYGRSRGSGSRRVRPRSTRRPSSPGTWSSSSARTSCSGSSTTRSTAASAPAR